MSEALNEIHAYFGKLNTTTTKKVSQWAYGQKLIIHDPELPPVFEAYYSNSRSKGTADPQIGTDGVVDAPHAYFRSGADIYVFLMVHEGQDDGRYKKVVHIPIDPCSEPSDVEPEPYEQNVIDQAIAVLNDAVEQTGEDKAATAALAEAAAASSLVATEAAQSAQGSATSASASASTASTAAATATTKAGEAAQSASEAESARASARNYAASASDSAGDADTAKIAAQSAAQTAQAAETAIKDMTVSAQTLPSGSAATVTKTEGTTTFNLDFGIPKGDSYILTPSDKEEIAETVAQSEEVQETIDRAVTVHPLSADYASVVTITDGADGIPMDACVAKIEPVQSGSGDPSPDNVRPISGLTGLNLVVSPTEFAEDGTTYPVSWQSEAGTVYGGTVDLVSGVLTVTHGYVDLGTLRWTTATASGTTRCLNQPSDGRFLGDKPIGICSGLLATTYLDRLVTDGTIYGNAEIIAIFLSSFGNQSGTNIKTALSGVQLVYELATPQTYQLTPVEVRTLLGLNNVWADTGDVSIVYSADLPLYIEQHAVKGDQGDDYVLTAADKQEIASEVSDMFVVEVTGRTPTITAQANTRYVCGELDTLDFTPSATGICDVIFTSGTTATVLTLPSSVKMPSGFSVAADTVYELNFLAGLGVYQTWAST